MKNMLTVILAIALVSACAQVGPNDKTVQALETVPDNAPSSVVIQAASVDSSSLSAQLADAANNPKLSAVQKQQLADPRTQQVITNVVQLAQANTFASRETAATNLATSVSSSGIDLSSLLSLLSTIAPILSAAVPTLAPFIDIAVAILPLIISAFGGSSAA